MTEFVYNPLYFMSNIPNIDENDNLRDPQKIAYAKIYDHFITANKTTDAIVVLPTGVGKTGLMGLLPFGISRGRVLIITPQIVIKDSVIGSLDPDFPDNFWLKHKVFEKTKDLPCLIEFEGAETKDEWLNSANIVIVNIQKLQSRLSNSLINRVSSDFFDMVIIDEAHHSTALTWLETIQHFSRAKVVKLTGTPFRSDGEKIVGEVVYEYKLSSAMAKGYVKSLENFFYVPEKLYLTMDGDNHQYTLDEILDQGLKDQDWISRSVAYSVECSEKVVLESINKLEKKLSNNNTVPHKIIAVACSIYHAKQVQELYENKGYKTAIVHSDMEKAAKEGALSDIENHRVQVVINVAMLGEGYDHPYLSVAAIFRPFKTLLPYAQFIGRVLRSIPSEEVTRASDNIAEIVCHQDLNLNSLWEYYKKEIQESETIKYLATINLDTGEDGSDDKDYVGKNFDKSYGVVIDKGQGKLIGDAYLTTQLIEQRKKEEEEDLRKLEGIQKLLGISAEEARTILLQTKVSQPLIKRPDLFIRRKRTGIDARIREDIVPNLLEKFNLQLRGTELKGCRLFKNTWLADRFHENGALLAIYINTTLKNMIGAKREEWVASDWEIAEQKLDQIEEYLIKILEEFMGS